MSLSDAFAWTALALVPANAAAGWVLRRRASGAFRTRMRPHLVLGYLAVAFAFAHTALSMGNAGSTNADGLWLATFALLGLAIQAFLGTNLQSPGTYRRPLRRWHTVLFWAVAALAVGHVVLNLAFLPLASAR